MGAFPRWQDYRLYALKKEVPEKTAFTYPIELSVNGGNPFAKENYTVCARKHGEEEREVLFCLASENRLFNPLLEAGKKKAHFPVSVSPDPGWDRLCLTADVGLYKEKRKAAVSVAARKPWL